MWRMIPSRIPANPAARVQDCVYCFQTCVIARRRLQERLILLNKPRKAMTGRRLVV